MPTGKKPDGNGIATQPPPGPRFRADHLNAVREMLSRCENVREGRMLGHPAFFVGRRMFACVFEDGVALKVPERLAAALLQRADTEPSRPYGKPKMREWVKIAHPVSQDYEADFDVFSASIDFVRQIAKGKN